MPCPVFSLKRSFCRRSILNAAIAIHLGLLSACAPVRIEVIAHRGATLDVPENTLAAIQRAIDLGCEYAEVDVQATRDGRLVLIHDATVDRTTNGSGPVEELSYTEISRLDAGVRFAESFRGTRVPLLEEALELARDRIKLYLDLKLADPGPAVDLVRQRRMSGRVRYHALTLNSLERIRRLDPDAEIIFDPDVLISVPGVVEAAVARLPGVLLGARVSAWSVEAAERARKLGAKIIVNVLEDESTEENMRKAIALRPAAIQVDEPGLLLKILRSLR
jgi:glycerophosphoryl diester phosphodiesterase